MTTLKYGYFGEDIAQQIFLRNYLLQLPYFLEKEQTLLFEEDITFPLKGHDRSRVRKLFVEAAQTGLTYHSQDVFFVGIDLDSRDKGAFETLFDQMTKELPAKIQPKTLIFIPVQCIEHWLLYLQFKREHPTSNKNEQYESIGRPDAKKKIYGTARPISDITTQRVSSLTQSVDIEWLAAHSYSFAHFHRQVLDFTKNFL
jgi:RNase adaptor protein for sRNA GlmZ degradation